MVKDPMEGDGYQLEAKLAYCVIIQVCIKDERRSNAVTHTRWICGSSAATLGFDIIR